MGTVYALSATDADTAHALEPLIAGSWSLAAVKRETNGWTMPLVMLGYLFALACRASFITYRVALAMGGD